MRILYIFLLLLALSPIGAQSNLFQFNNITTEDGLSQSSVTAFHQDRLGRMWIGTRDGLNKFDGSRFTIYRNEPSNNKSISNNDILSITEDKDGFLWIGTFGGLNKYDPKQDTFQQFLHHNIESSIINNTVWCIKEMSDNMIWIGTSNGLSIYNKENKTFTNLEEKGQPDTWKSTYYILSIVETTAGAIYLGTSNGLAQIEILRDRSYQLTSIPETNSIYIQDIIEAADGNLIIGTRDQGVLSYNPQDRLLMSYFDDETSKKIRPDVRRLVYDNLGDLWIGSDIGVNILMSDGNITHLKNDYGNPNSLIKNSVKSIYKDKKGSIWVGTYNGGISLWDETNLNFITYKKNSSEQTLSSSNAVISIINFGNDTIIFGLKEGGLTILDKKRNQSKTIPPNEIDNAREIQVKALYVDQKKRLWIGTFKNGIKIYDVINAKSISNVISRPLQNHLKQTGVYDIKEDTEGNFYFCTFGKGLIKYNYITQEYITFQENLISQNGLSNNLVRTITIDSKRNAWVGTQHGLNKITPDGKIQQFFYQPQLRSGEDILCVFEDSKDMVWVGTRAHGLYKFEKDLFIKIPLKTDNIHISTIRSIQEDHKGALWISTNQGLICFNQIDNTTTSYHIGAGLINDEFNDKASVKIGNSVFYFGGPFGAISFDSDLLTKNDYVPQVFISDLKIKNKSVEVLGPDDILSKAIPYTKSIELSHLQGNFSLQLSMPNFIHSVNNQYKYRLTGLDEEWVTTNLNEVYYTIQSPREYIFEVYGANNDGLWNESPTRLIIDIKPAPWLSTWAYLLYGLIIISAFYYIQSILSSKTKLKHQLELEQILISQEKEINQAKLDFFTNISHDFRTPLTLILAPLQQIIENYKGASTMYKKLLTIERSANHLLQLINRLMDFRKLETKQIKLKAAEGNIVPFIREIYLSFSQYAENNNYKYEFTSSDDSINIYFDQEKLVQVFYNLISNAFKYTLEGGSIKVTVSKGYNEVEIGIEDSGIGIPEKYHEKIFDRYFEVEIDKNTSPKDYKGTGIGLSIVKNIVELHKGKISVSNNSFEKGTVFKIKLLTGKNHLSEAELSDNFISPEALSNYYTSEGINYSDILLETPIIEHNKKVVLLVEDNIALRSFMRDLLIKRYTIIEGENGQQAFMLAIKHSPDLIISDIMMPVMDGIQLCAKIKQDIKTSHIPVILLTSKSSLGYRLEGLESGADDYISKPFDVREFKFRIHNLLESNARLQEKFASSDSFKPSEINLSSIDENLYKNALEIVEDNISNDQFNIDAFCTYLGVSRSMLFTKIKAWTNLTPNEFIQHFRMKRAAQLLEQGKINVSEVSYNVGYKNPKYFSKIFQKKFGKTPTQYTNMFSVQTLED